VASSCCALALAWSISSVAIAQQTREEKVRADKQKVEAEGFWIYNDLDKAYGLARETGKPILVTLRCIPCEECVKLDDDLVDTDPVIRPLLEQFVCVRIVGTNGLDLDTFQYDTDQSFAVFMLNADKTIYGRFGTRSHRTDWVGDVSLTGMAQALSGALALHADYPANKNSLAAKRGAPLEFASPELYPSLSEKYTDQLNYSGEVVKSCIHCHQIGDARRDYYWNNSQAVPEDLLFPYPHPKAIGLVLDPDKKAVIKNIIEGSPAAAAGLELGDEISHMQGQPLLSMADVQWVLQHIPADGGVLNLNVLRDGESTTKTIALAKGWRRADDISWRVSSWGLRRIATGGMRLNELDAASRRERGIEGKMALEVSSLGKFGPHATALKTGFKEGDVLVEFNGQDALESEAALFAHVCQNCRAGVKVPVKFVRNGKIQSLMLPIQQ
jgi:serine protease Do